MAQTPPYGDEAVPRRPRGAARSADRHEAGNRVTSRALPVTTRSLRTPVTGVQERVGRFEYHYETRSWAWSDAVARMHGYDPGAVEPTTELVMSHLHPDDLAGVKALLRQSASPFSSRHRLRTTTGEERKVIVVGDAVTDDGDGRIVATRGFYIDITDGFNAELQQSLGEELQVVVANRAIIEQAKGMLMAVYSLSEDSAFEVLRWRSQAHNVKVSFIAKKYVAVLPGLINPLLTSRAPVDHYLMTLGKPEP